MQPEFMLVLGVTPSPSCSPHFCPHIVLCVRTTPRGPMVAANYVKRRRTTRDGTPLLSSVCLVSPSPIEEEDIVRGIGGITGQLLPDARVVTRDQRPQ